jgi:glycosyltransferase involved in cell wall biosynthesis
MTNNSRGLSFIIPAYNEEESISNTLRRIKGTLSRLTIPFEIILVNDGSTDKTRELAQQFEVIKVINHPVNIGYGNSLKTGIKDAQYEWIGIVDADGTYPIEDVPTFVSEMEKGFDMVIGARDNISELDMPVKKGFRWIFKTIVRLFIGKNIRDPNSGLRLFRRDIAISLFPFLCGTFSFTTSLTILATGKSCFIKYIPINYYPREGKSKVRHFSDSLRTLQYITQGITFFNPIKFFLILSMVMILLVCIPAMFIALFEMHTLSLYYMIFGTAVTLLIAMGILGDIIRISATQRSNKPD